ncbi:MAG: iron ABC transporter permease [Clostridia bacterium]|nr:iron ABC transporter permease [Clostridia bacterium]
MRIYSTSSTARKCRKGAALLGLALMGAILLSLCAGASGVSLWDGLGHWLAGQNTPAARIIAHIRLPRTLAAIAAGAALACSGVLIQGVLGNPLAGPNVIGVNAGAGFMTLLIAAFFPSAGYLLPGAAFAGALGASLIIFLLAEKTGASRMTLILAGVTISAILSSASDLITTLAPEAALGMSSFLIGGFSGVTHARLAYGIVCILPALIAAWALARALDLMGLGDEVAQSLGLPVRKMRLLLLGIASLLAGAAVSFSGLLGFVGLLIPHMVRKLTGHEHRWLIPLSMLGGAVFVLLCDTAARTLFAPYELPVGILLSLIGGPFFLYLLLRHRKGGRS